MNWTVNLDNATFDFSEDAWVASADLELTGAELKRFNRLHPRAADGTFTSKGSGSSSSSGSSDSDGKNKNGSSSGSKSGKSSGPARFKDSNGDGKDDRQLTPAQLKQALAGLPESERKALAIYPSVLGALKLAIQNNESLAKHLNRLPPELRDAAERAARVAATRGSGANADGSSGGSEQTPKDATKLSEAEVERLTNAGWAGNPSDQRERLYPPGHPKNPKNGKKSGGMVRAEDGSLVPRSFYDNSERAWSVDLDGASFDFSEVAWRK